MVRRGRRYAIRVLTGGARGVMLTPWRWSEDAKSLALCQTASEVYRLPDSYAYFVRFSTSNVPYSSTRDSTRLRGQALESKCGEDGLLTACLIQSVFA